MSGAYFDDKAWASGVENEAAGPPSKEEEHVSAEASMLMNAPLSPDPPGPDWRNLDTDMSAHASSDTVDGQRAAKRARRDPSSSESGGPMHTSAALTRPPQLCQACEKRPAVRMCKLAGSPGVIIPMCAGCRSFNRRAQAAIRKGRKLQRRQEVRLAAMGQRGGIAGTDSPGAPTAAADAWPPRNPPRAAAAPPRTRQPRPERRPRLDVPAPRTRGEAPTSPTRLVSTPAGGSATRLASDCTWTPSSLQLPLAVPREHHTFVARYHVTTRRGVPRTDEVAVTSSAARTQLKQVPVAPFQCLLPGTYSARVEVLAYRRTTGELDSTIQVARPYKLCVRSDTRPRQPPAVAVRGDTPASLFPDVHEQAGTTASGSYDTELSLGFGGPPPASGAASFPVDALDHDDAASDCSTTTTESRCSYSSDDSSSDDGDHAETVVADGVTRQAHHRQGRMLPAPAFLHARPFSAKQVLGQVTASGTAATRRRQPPAIADTPDVRGQAGTPVCCFCGTTRLPPPPATPQGRLLPAWMSLHDSAAIRGTPWPRLCDSCGRSFLRFAPGKRPTIHLFGRNSESSHAAGSRATRHKRLRKLPVARPRPFSAKQVLGQVTASGTAAERVSTVGSDVRQWQPTARCRPTPALVTPTETAAEVDEAPTVDGSSGGDGTALSVYDEGGKTRCQSTHPHFMGGVFVAAKRQAPVPRWIRTIQARSDSVKVPVVALRRQAGRHVDAAAVSEVLAARLDLSASPVHVVGNCGTRLTLGGEAPAPGVEASYTVRTASSWHRIAWDAWHVDPSLNAPTTAARGGGAGAGDGSGAGAGTGVAIDAGLSALTSWVDANPASVKAQWTRQWCGTVLVGAPSVWTGAERHMAPPIVRFTPHLCVPAVGANVVLRSLDPGAPRANLHASEARLFEGARFNTMDPELEWIRTLTPAEASPLSVDRGGRCVYCTVPCAHELRHTATRANGTPCTTTVVVPVVCDGSSGDWDRIEAIERRLAHDWLYAEAAEADPFCNSRRHLAMAAIAGPNVQKGVFKKELAGGKQSCKPYCSCPTAPGADAE